jgi:outer membrane protein assembly factor BamB
MKPPRLPLLLLLAASTTVHGADWPRWRGPNRDDVSTETGLLKQWPETGPKKLWMSAKAGLGYSGCAVVQGVLYTMGLEGDTEQLLAFDANTGDLKWSTPIGPIFTNKWGDGPRGTPAVDGNRVYALSGQGYLLCANCADGKPVWTAALKDFGGKPPGWGYTESLLVDGNNVVCTPGGAQGTMLALDKTTGKKVWQSTDWTDPAQYASIVPADIHGARQYVALTAQHIAGIDAKSGAKLWLADFSGRTAVIPTPIVLNNTVYVASGYGVGCKLIHIGAKNVVQDGWTNTNMVNHHGGVVLVDGYLYGYSDKGGWTCQDWKTGEVKWAEKKLGKGAVHCADGMLYLLEESSGTVVLIDASPNGWKEYSRFKLDPQTTQRKPDGRIWTHPVVSDGKLYLRDQELLFCYDIQDRTKRAAAPAKTVALSNFTDPESAKQAAMKLYPALGVPGSPFNQAFLNKFRQLQQVRPEVLKNPNWPMLLAEEVASDLKK